MQREKLNSTRLKSIGYSAATGTMEVEFPNTKAPALQGAVYAYHGVPPEIHAALMKHDNPGQYFADTIVKDKKSPAFKYELVSKAAAPDLTDPGLPKVKPEPKPIEGNIVQMPMKTNHVAIIDPALARDPHTVTSDGHALAISYTPPVTFPTEYTALLAHAQSIRTRVQALVKVEGVKVALVLTTPEAFEEVGRLFVTLSAEKKAAARVCEDDKKKHYAPYQEALTREKTVLGEYAVLDVLDKAIVAYKAEKEAERRVAQQAAQAAEQKRLDAEASERAKEATATAQRESQALEAAGHTKAAEIVRATPAPVVAQTAAPVMFASEIPKVDGMRETGTWKVEIENAGLVPLYFKDPIRQAMSDAMNAAREEGQSILDDAAMTRLTLKLAGIFGEFYSIDDTKLNGYLKPKKELGINLVPGVKVWRAAKTSTTGR